jgi:hypothetical protein
VGSPSIFNRAESFTGVDYNREDEANESSPWNDAQEAVNNA